MESSVTPVGLLCLGAIRRDPGRPAKLAEFREAHRLDGGRWKRELDLPFELFAGIEKYQIDQRLAARAGRQKLHIFSHVLRNNTDPDLVLHAEHACADQDIATESAIALADACAIISLESEISADELLDLDSDTEQAGDQLLEARSGFCLRGHQAGKRQLAGVGDTIELMIDRRSEPDHAAYIGNEAVFSGPIPLRDRPRIRPGAKEQLQKTIIQKVEEARKG